MLSPHELDLEKLPGFVYLMVAEALMPPTQEVHKALNWFNKHVQSSCSLILSGATKSNYFLFKIQPLTSLR